MAFDQIGLFNLDLKAQTEKIAIADVDQDAVSQNVSAYETLDVLPLQRRLNHCGFNDDVIWEHEPDHVFTAGDIGGTTERGYE